MRLHDYHELATVHHDAKADVYAAAGFGAKAAGHRHRARWHASFGSSSELPSYDVMKRTYKDWSLSESAPAPSGKEAGADFQNRFRPDDKREYDEHVRRGAVLAHATPKFGGRQRFGSDDPSDSAPDLEVPESDDVDDHTQETGPPNTPRGGFYAGLVAPKRERTMRLPP